MFKWYKRSSICYVYLDDIEQYSEYPALLTAEQLRRTKWVTRGWTLQELIAPDIVWFFNKNWSICGDRVKLTKPLFEVTNIDQNILQRDPGARVPLWLYSLSISKRMSWAANRKTTRPEDIAYCLLGIFDINIPLLYGEGSIKAFYRLQEEIMRYSTDQTLLAWSQQRKTQLLVQVFLKLHLLLFVMALELYLFHPTSHSR
jgi:hypothetical protein